MDTFRDGSAPLVIRRKGAAGDLPVSLEEKIEILILLVGDKDEETRQKAQETLQGWSAQDLQQVLSNPTCSPALLDLAATHLVGSREELIEALLQNPSASEETRDRILEHLAAAPPPSAPAEETTPEEETSPEERETLIQKIGRMSAVEKVKLALIGNQESRAILIRDPNKIVSRSVLQSPKVTDSEAEVYASAKNVSEEVLRLIAANRKFRKSYAVIRALVHNPRAPIDVTLALLNRLNEKDLKEVIINRNVPDVLRTMSTKMIKTRQEAQKPKIPRKH